MTTTTPDPSEIARQAVGDAFGNDTADPSDGTFARGALDAFFRLAFGQLIPIEQAAQLVYDALTYYGFRGNLEFGYSHGEQRTQEGEKFSGPFMRVRTRTGELHVLRIGVKPELIDWVDGIA